MLAFSLIRSFDPKEHVVHDPPTVKTFGRLGINESAKPELIAILVRLFAFLVVET
jgi:hypothetical protein